MFEKVLEGFNTIKGDRYRGVGELYDDCIEKTFV